jgi:hypothetical protein
MNDKVAGIRSLADDGRPKKGLFLLIDAFRYDVFSDPEAAEIIVPNMARMAKRGLTHRCVANAQSTQFVLPAIFSQTYPLDHGGYNNGIRERPQSFIESLKEAGFETHLIASANQIGVGLGYDRGFDSIRTTTDYRTLLEQRISRTLSYDINLWRNGQRSEAATISIIRKELGILLEALETGIRGHDKSLWPPGLHHINSEVAKGCASERKLLAEDPVFVIQKLERIPAGVYWRFLGARRISPVKLFFSRAKAGFTWRLHRFAATRHWFPFLLVGHYLVKSEPVIQAISEYVRANKEKPWFIYMHAMDVHDCRCVNDPLHILYRLKYLPRWWRARLTGKTRRRWLYDTAAMYVDECLGDLFKVLEDTSQLDATSIVITGDHGLSYARSPRGYQNVAIRNYHEDIEIPMILVGGSGTARAEDVVPREVMVDSMGICASFLETLGVPQHHTFKGKSIFQGGRDAVISESAGSGNADVARRNLYFTVTNPTHRLMTVLAGNELRLLHLYDLSQDPDEQNDLLAERSCEALVGPLIKILIRERAEILEMRGALAGVMRQEWSTPD